MIKSKNKFDLIENFYININSVSNMTKIKFIVKQYECEKYNNKCCEENLCSMCRTDRHYDRGKTYEECGRNDTDAFVEWFDKNVQTLACEDDDVDLDIMKEWCKKNNHEWRDDGVYNMNVFIKWTEDFCDRDTCYFCGIKNNGDWEDGMEDAVCVECDDKWKYNENEDGYECV